MRHLLYLPTITMVSGPVDRQPEPKADTAFLEKAVRDKVSSIDN